MTVRTSIIWLRCACVITILIGLISALASYPATDGVWLLLFDVLKWPLDGNPAAFSDDTRAVNAVLGGTMVGWGVLMYLLATPQRIHALPEVPRLLLIGLVAWFVVDCIGSILAGLPGNIVLNVSFLVLFVPPLWVLQQSKTA
ncbi:MAG: hypothetical protein ACK5GU_05015 [Chloroflexota bacterium]|jgi:hypothetical protein